MPITTEQLHLSGATEAPVTESTSPCAETLAAYRGHNPYRRLDWRWQRAAELLRFGEAPNPFHDDRWTHRALEFQRLSADCPVASLAEAFPEIHAALEIHTVGGAPCWEVQARVLARETSDCIEAKTGIPSAVVVCYEKLFFAVLERIDNPTYIESAALPELPFTGDDVAAIWNHCGYWYGPHLLDEIIEDFQKSGRPDYTHLMAEGDCWKSRSRFQRLLDRTIGLLLFKVSINNLTALLQLQRTVTIAGHRGERSSPRAGIHDLIDEGIFELFSTLPDDDVAVRAVEDVAA